MHLRTYCDICGIGPFTTVFCIVGYTVVHRTVRRFLWFKCFISHRIDPMASIAETAISHTSSQAMSQLAMAKHAMRQQAIWVVCPPGIKTNLLWQACGKHDLWLLRLCWLVFRAWKEDCQLLESLTMTSELLRTDLFRND